jgi:arginine:agmatine antiporter
MLNETTEPDPDPHHRHKLGPWLASILVAGNMIGSGIYGLPASLGAVGSVGLLGWVLATIGAFGVAGVFAALGRVSRNLDGVVGYAEEGLGRFAGFATAILYWMGLWTGVVAIAVAAAGYLSVFFPVFGTPFGRALGTAVVIWIMTFVNMVSPKLMARTGGVTLIAGLVPVLAVATLGWLWFDPHQFAASWNVSGKSDFFALQSAMVGGYWAYTGLESAAVAASVVRRPERNIPIATLAGTGLAAFVYLASCAVLLGLEPAQSLAQSSAPFALAFSKVAGPSAGAVVAVCAILKTSGALGGWILLTAQTARAGADAHLVGGRLAHSQTHTPPRRILLGMAVMMSALALGTISPTFGKQFAVLLDVATVWSIIPYIVCAIALLRIAQVLKRRRRLVQATVGIAVVITSWAVATSRVETLWLTLVLCLAIVALWFALRRRAQPAAA